MRAGGSAVYAVALIACGRVHFEPTNVDDSGTNLIGDDGRADTPPAASCPAFATFCDDFESGDLGKWTDVAVSGTGSIMVTSSRVRSGAFALESRALPTTADGSRGSAVFGFPQRSSGTLAARSWINLGAPLREFNVVLLFENNLTPQFVSVTGDNAGNWTSTEESTAGNFDHFSMVATPPLDTWTCVELVVIFGVGSARFKLFINEALVIDVMSMDPEPAYNEVFVGLTRADQTGFHVFTDDVVIAEQRIGCE